MSIRSVTITQTVRYYPDEDATVHSILGAISVGEFSPANNDVIDEHVVIVDEEGVVLHDSQAESDDERDHRETEPDGIGYVPMDPRKLHDPDRDWWVDGHYISAPTTEKAKAEAERLYEYVSFDVRPWTEADQRALDESADLDARADAEAEAETDLPSKIERIEELEAKATVGGNFNLNNLPEAGMHELVRITEEAKDAGWERVTTPPLNSAHPLAEASNGDTYFVGHDLEAAKRLVLRDRWVRVERNNDHVRVALCDDEACTSEAEWGASASEEEAWRFALGAAMGPIDAEYDESRLIAMLQTA